MDATEPDLADLADLADLLAPWELGVPVRVTAPARGTNNWVRLVDLPGPRRVVVRRYRNVGADRVAAEHAVLAALAAAGLPFAVPDPLPATDGRTWVDVPAGDGTEPLAVLRWIDGVRPPEGPVGAAALGSAIGRLHVALAGLPAALAPYDWRHPLAAVHPAAGSLDDLLRDLAGAPGLPDRGTLERVDQAYLDLLGRAPVQIVHQDPALSNVVVEAGTDAGTDAGTGGVDGRVRGVLDFDMVGLDLRVADVATALLAIGSPEHAGLDRPAAFLRAYRAEVAPTAAEAAALPDLMRRRAAGTLVWRYGRFRRGQDDRSEVVARLPDLAEVERWLDAYAEPLVDLAAGTG